MELASDRQTRLLPQEKNSNMPIPAVITHTSNHRYSKPAGIAANALHMKYGFIGEWLVLSTLTGFGANEKFNFLQTRTTLGHLQ